VSVAYTFVYIKYERRQTI